MPRLVVVVIAALGTIAVPLAALAGDWIAVVLIVCALTFTAIAWKEANDGTPR
jgi:hypothetical protein